MKRDKADKMATSLIECGINRKNTLTIVSVTEGATIDEVKTIKRWLLKYGNSEGSILCQAEMLENGWADKELNLETQ
jgi:hypothetical protein